MNIDAEAVAALRDALASARARTRAAVETANRDAYVVVHPDDEDAARAALDAVPAELRPRLVVSPTVPSPGTAHYTRPMPIGALASHDERETIDPLEFLGGPQ